MTLLHHPSDNSFALRAGPFSADNGRLRIVLAGGTFDSASPVIAAAAIHLQIHTDADAAVRLTIHNRGSESIRIDRLEIHFAPDAFAAPLASRRYRQLIHGGTLDRLCAVKPVSAPTAWCDVNADSDLLAVYADQTSPSALLLGALPPFGDDLTTFQTLHAQPHMEGDFGFAIIFDLRCTLPPQGSATTAPVIAIHSKNPNALLEQYASLMARRRGRAGRPVVTGWNSWDYYAGAVRRQDMDDNLVACRRHFGDRVRYMVIDEGYECQWGVWEAGWKFPQGLEDYCRHVRAAGCEPGIWTAPLLVNMYTPLFREHPDWFASDKTGNVVLRAMAYGTMGLLDITHPDVQAHLRAAYARLRDAGFTYFKCDFTQELLHAEQFHNRTVGRGRLVRLAFELIREVAGEDAYILSAGAPFQSVIGLVDACRITPDIAPFAANICQNIRNIICRSWMHRGIGNIDPDFAIVRCPQTTDDTQITRRLVLTPQNRGVRWKDGGYMNLDEARMLLLALYMTGGDIVLGDAIHRLNGLGIDCLRRILTPAPASAVPVNRFDPAGLTAPLLLSRTDCGALVGCFNLTDESVCHDLNDIVVRSDGQPRDFWSDTPVTLSPSKMLTVPARSAVGLVFGSR